MSANNRLYFDGLEELKGWLRALPSALGGEAVGIVDAAAQGAADRIIAKYPTGTFGRKRHGRAIQPGNLKSGVQVEEIASGPFGAARLISSRAPHAWIFENGTQARQYVTKAGKTHVLGAMPPGRVFLPEVIQARYEMYAALKDMLVRHGLRVSGLAGTLKLTGEVEAA